MTNKEIEEILKKIKIPNTQENIISSGILKSIEIKNKSINIVLTTKNPALHFKKNLHDAIEFNLNRILSDKFEIKVDFEIKIENQNSRKILPHVKKVICIASGKGGVGKSTVTLNLAGSLIKKGYNVGILDADIYGPSMPTMTDSLGSKPSMIESDEKKMIKPLEINSLKIMSIGYFTDQSSAVVWRGPMASKALNQMITDVYWGELDFLLIDLPPGTGDIHLSLIQNSPLDGAIVVSTPQEVALADARRGIKMFQLESINIPIIGLIENMSWFTPRELPENKYYIFGRNGVRNLANGLNLPFLGEIPLIEGLRESCDSGIISTFYNDQVKFYFNELAENLLNELSLNRNEN